MKFIPHVNNNNNNNNYNNPLDLNEKYNSDSSMQHGPLAGMRPARCGLGMLSPMFS
jgi:hypothetical protein